MYILSVAFECILFWIGDDDLDHENSLVLLKVLGVVLLGLGGIIAFAAVRIAKENYPAPSKSDDSKKLYSGERRWRTVRYDQFKK